MNIKKILILLIFAIAIVGIIAPASAAIESANKDKVYSVESKEKTVKYKITWNANGGITTGLKKTTTTYVEKGSKIGKLPIAVHMYHGFRFDKWSTKKKGGDRITINTKPTKDVTYYAQYKKFDSKNNKKKTNTEIKKEYEKEKNKQKKKDDKKTIDIIGKWRHKDDEGTSEFTFKSDGNYLQSDYDKFADMNIAREWEGSYSVKSTNSKQFFVTGISKKYRANDYRYGYYVYNHDTGKMMEGPPGQWSSWVKVATDKNGVRWYYQGFNFEYNIINGKEYLIDSGGDQYKRV